MDWTSVAKLVAPLAPGLGGLLGGLIPFPGAALAGQAIGTIIARQFGVEATPAAVGAALANNPNEVVLAKLQAAAEEARAQWPALAQMEKAWAQTQGIAITQINDTMRMEIAPENRHWFFTGWRPMAGWIFDVSAVIFLVLLIFASWQALHGNDKPLTTLTAAWPIFAAYFGLLAAMVGVYVVGRSQEKAKTIEAVPTVVPPVVAKVTKR